MEERIGKVRRAMIDYFGADGRRIDHALRVAGHAEEIVAREPGDREVILAAAFLHDIGIHEAEAKYGSTAGNLQEMEGPPIAREILASLGYDEAFIREVCAIIASHHSPGEVDSDNFRVIWDADWLVNMGDEVDLNDAARVAETIARVFMTPTGRGMAERLYLGQRG